MATIRKKTWPEFFEAVASGKKNFDVRLNDFEVKEGDTLVLEEWSPKTNAYTGRTIEKCVTYVLKVDPKNTFWPQEEIEEKGLQVISLE